ncbi:MAG: thiamine phosphate synthase [Deltaproteobacteria bacterium]|nr:thiamine phosphate synthase [Deltaproteobacteria bacterium]
MEMLKNKIQLPNIYPIIDISLISSDKIGETAHAVIDGGAKILQLRAKKLSSREFLETARIIRKITKDKGAVFIVNDRIDIALLTDADGVHLGQDDLPVKEARRLLGNNKIIGYSTHNIREARAAKKLPVDYISFGPIFATKTKEDAQTPKGLKGLDEIMKAVKIPIVAIGGITETNMAHVLKQGVESVAMISEILTAKDISQKINRLIFTAKEIKRP